MRERTIQIDVLIEKSALNEVVRYLYNGQNWQKNVVEEEWFGLESITIEIISKQYRGDEIIFSMNIGLSYWHPSQN